MSKFEIIGYEEGMEFNERPTISYWQDTWRSLQKNQVAMGALLVLILLTIMAIIGPNLRGYDYINMDIAQKNKKLQCNVLVWNGSTGKGSFFKSLGRCQSFDDHSVSCNYPKAFYGYFLWRDDGAFWRLGR